VKRTEVDRDVRSTILRIWAKNDRIRESPHTGGTKKFWGQQKNLGTPQKPWDLKLQDSGGSFRYQADSIVPLFSVDEKPNSNQITPQMEEI